MFADTDLHECALLFVRPIAVPTFYFRFLDNFSKIQTEAECGDTSANLRERKHKYRHIPIT